VILEVASSNFPRFDRNLNTAESPESSSEAQEATNAIYTIAATRRSCLCLLFNSGFWA